MPYVVHLPHGLANWPTWGWLTDLEVHYLCSFISLSNIDILNLKVCWNFLWSLVVPLVFLIMSSRRSWKTYLQYMIFFKSKVVICCVIAFLPPDMWQIHWAFSLTSLAYSVNNAKMMVLSERSFGQGNFRALIFNVLVKPRESWAGHIQLLTGLLACCYGNMFSALLLAEFILGSENWTVCH